MIPSVLSIYHGLSSLPPSGKLETLKNAPLVHHHLVWQITICSLSTRNISAILLPCSNDNTTMQSYHRVQHHDDDLVSQGYQKNIQVK